MQARTPTAFYTIATNDDDTFTHTFISERTGDVIVSKRCVAKACNCAGCKIVDALYVTEDGPVKIIEGDDWRKPEDGDGTLMIHAIYIDIEFLVRFVSRDQNLVHEFTPNVFESPIEKMFYELAFHELNMYPQYPVGPYRLDFAIPEKRIAIELDGHEYHKTKEHRTRDAARDRYLTENDWTVLRFTGTEIYKNTKACVDQICRIADKRTTEINR